METKKRIKSVAYTEKHYKNLTDSYKTYQRLVREKLPEYTKFVSPKVYRQIAHKFFKYIMDRVILDGDTVNLPGKTGLVKVVGTKKPIVKDENGNITGLAPNWKKTKELHDTCPECKERNQIVYNTNEHSDGIRYRFFWSVKDMYIENKNFYNLKFTRYYKRYLSDTIMNGMHYDFSHDRIRRNRKQENET